MREFILFIFAAIFFGLHTGNTQISMSVSTDREKYIRFEPIKVTVSLKNYSGQTLSFANTTPGDKGYLKFHITDIVGRAIRSSSNQDVDPTAELILPPGATKSVTLVISEFFDLQEDDDYELFTRVGHSRFRHDFLSNPVHFQVRSGTRVWSREVGLPDLEDGKLIATRICSLNSIHYDSGDLYFLLIEDDNYVYATLRLGPRVLGISPQCEVDALSRMHTLIQTEPRLFNYRIFDLKGEMKQNSYYMIEQTTPKLLRDQDLGTITVEGGKQAVEGIDFNRITQTNSSRDAEWANQQPEIEFDSPIPSVEGQ